MLRITEKNGSRPTTLQLDGKLAGPWVEELERAWRRLSASSPDTPIIVDLSGVTFIDSEGRKLLSSMVEQGADLRAAHLMTKYIVDQVKEGCRSSAKVGG